MKKSALLLAGVMTASVAIVPLAACSAPKGSEFKVENYARPMSDYTSFVGEGLSFTSVDTLNFEVETLNAGHLLKKVGTGNNLGKYQLLDSKTNEPVVSDWFERIYGVESLSWRIGREYLAFHLELDGNTQYFGPDGKPLTSDDVYVPVWEESLFSTELHDVAGKKGVTVYVFSYYALKDDGQPEEEETKKYFTYLENDNGERVWKSVTENELDPEDGEGDYVVGKEPGIDKTPLSGILGFREEDYPDYPHFDYSYSFEGDNPIAGNDSPSSKLISGVYTFWKDGENKGSVTIENGNYVGIAGDNVFFYEIAPVSADAKEGYNVEINAGISVMKMQYTLYSYNFVKGGKAKEVKTDYVIMDQADMLYYNLESNLFDMWRVGGAYKMTNGVAVVSAYTKSYKLLLDEKGHVSVDLTNKSLDDSFYKLADNRYLSGSMIVDGKLNTVAQFQEKPFLWESAELLRVSTSDGVAFVDFSGKVAIAPISGYEAGFYFDDVMITRIDGEYMSFSKNNPKGTPVEELVKYDEETEQVTPYGTNGLNLLVKRTLVAATSAGKSDTYSYSLYDYNGTQIGSTLSGFSNMNLGYHFTVGSNVYVRMLKGDDTVTIILK